MVWHRPSILVKILGVYKVHVGRAGRTTHNLVVMDNLFHRRPVTRVFDLKGLGGEKRFVRTDDDDPPAEDATTQAPDAAETTTGGAVSATADAASRLLVALGCCSAAAAAVAFVTGAAMSACTLSVSGSAPAETTRVTCSAETPAAAATASMNAASAPGVLHGGSADPPVSATT